MLVDDERLARQALRRALSKIPAIEVIGEADSVAAAREILAREPLDAIFLDVQMPRASGFELFTAGSISPKVIFVTAHSEHAARAFDVEAVDYLLKPVRATRLAVAVNRLRAACEGTNPSEENYEATDRICLQTPERTVVATVSQIVALEADGDFTRVSVSGDMPLMICRSLGSYEQVLPTKTFVRVDRSLMVNRHLVRRWRRVSRDEGLIWLEGKEDPVRLGRAAQARLRKALGREPAPRNPNQ